MIEVTGHAQFDAWAAKTMPPVEEVRPGVWSIPVTFPHNPMRYTLAYLLVGHGESVVVDPGWDSEQGWGELTAGLAVAGVELAALTGIVVTHYHPDHLGMAGRLQDATGAWLALGEAEIMPNRWAPDQASFIARDTAQYRSWGVPAERIAEVTFAPGSWAELIELDEPGVRLQDGQLLPVAGLDVQVVATPGHTSGHIALLDRAGGYVLTGDHVLPRITPHLSLEVAGSTNPVAQYLSSLEFLAAVVDDAAEVFPAHEYRFKGLGERTEQLIAHVQERSREVAAAMTGGSTVWDVASKVTWSRGFESLKGYTLRLALAETASHMAYLR